MLKCLRSSSIPFGVWYLYGTKGGCSSVVCNHKESRSKHSSAKRQRRMGNWQNFGNEQFHNMQRKRPCPSSQKTPYLHSVAFALFRFLHIITESVPLRFTDGLQWISRIGGFSEIHRSPLGLSTLSKGTVFWQPGCLYFWSHYTTGCSLACSRPTCVRNNRKKLTRMSISATRYRMCSSCTFWLISPGVVKGTPTNRSKSRINFSVNPLFYFSHTHTRTLIYWQATSDRMFCRETWCLRRSPTICHSPLQTPFIPSEMLKKWEYSRFLPVIITSRKAKARSWKQQSHCEASLLLLKTSFGGLLIQIYTFATKNK